MNHLVRYYDELWHVEITQIKTCHLFHGTPSKLTENNLEPKGHKYGLSKKRNVPQQALRNSCELLRQRKELHASSKGTACKLM